MNLTKSFTLILLIKGRHEFTRRWLSYMKKINFGHPIIIADGQDDEETEKIIKEINNDQNLSIQYFRYNTHSGYHDYYKMESDVLDKVKTDLVMLCDNDDFIIPVGLSEQIIFLSKNPDYISVSGRILNFEINNYDYSTYGDEVTFLNPCNYYRLDDPLEDWKEHINSVFTKFQPNFYNVFQTKFRKLIAEEKVRLNFSDLVINEFYVQLRAASFGKSKILDTTSHYLRQRGTSSISRNYDFSEDLLEKNMPEDVRKLATKIAEISSDQFNYSKDEIYSFILSDFSKYLNHYLPRATLKYRFPKTYRLKCAIINFFIIKLKFFYNKKKFFFSNLVLRKIFSLSKSKMLSVEINFIKNFLKKKS
tara:strand:- start:3168 stop:4256 length:1089 start_codon:yes stop_codon:yes gene_type:complete